MRISTSFYLFSSSTVLVLGHNSRHIGTIIQLVDRRHNSIISI